MTNDDFFLSSQSAVANIVSLLSEMTPIACLNALLELLVFGKKILHLGLVFFHLQQGLLLFLCRALGCRRSLTKV
jgi:hypothetical protein